MGKILIGRIVVLMLAILTLRVMAIRALDSEISSKSERIPGSAEVKVGCGLTKADCNLIAQTIQTWRE